MASVSLEVGDLRVLESGDTSEGKDPFLKGVARGQILFMTELETLLVLVGRPKSFGEPC